MCNIISPFYTQKKANQNLSKLYALKKILFYNEDNNVAFRKHEPDNWWDQTGQHTDPFEKCPFKRPIKLYL